MKKLVTVLLLITIFSCALVLVGCTVNKDKNGDQIGQSNTLTTDPIVGKYMSIWNSYLLITKDGLVKRYKVGYHSDNTPYLIEGGESYNTDYWVYHKDTETYEVYDLNPISGEKVNVSYYNLSDIKDGKIINSSGELKYTRITDDEWPDCIPEE
ncbi:MAG: hypothetical protein SO434_04980 [Eubacteriales bacterium]|nr:hypothetical protein [Eubacteriales bacterium]